MIRSSIRLQQPLVGDRLEAGGDVRLDHPSRTAAAPRARLRADDPARAERTVSLLLQVRGLVLDRHVISNASRETSLFDIRDAELLHELLHSPRRRR